MKILRVFGSVAVIGLISFSLLELQVRLLYPCPWYGYARQPPQVQLFQYDAELGWAGRPLSTGYFAALDFMHEVRPPDSSTTPTYTT